MNPTTTSLKEETYALPRVMCLENRQHPTVRYEDGRPYLEEPTHRLQEGRIYTVWDIIPSPFNTEHKFYQLVEMPVGILFQTTFFIPIQD